MKVRTPEENRIRQRLRRERLRAEGRCFLCLQLLDGASVQHCSKCLTHLREYRRRYGGHQPRTEKPEPPAKYAALMLRRKAQRAREAVCSHIWDDRTYATAYVCVRCQKWVPKTPRKEAR